MLSTSFRTNQQTPLNNEASVQVTKGLIEKLSNVYVHPCYNQVTMTAERQGVVSI